jgi:ABC-2 type transport system permease protein
MDALIALVRKDITLYFSNRRALMVTLAAPILIAAFFGSVMGGAPKKATRVPVAVVDLDGSAVTKDVIAAMKADESFDLRVIDEPEALRLVREGKVRAAAVFPAGFGEAAPKALFRPKAAKPEVVVHYDPSQAMALPLVKGLLAEHVMAAVGRAAFSGTSSPRLVADARAEIAASRSMEPAASRDLLALLDSVERLQVRQRENPTAGAAPTFAMPFETRQSEVTSGVDRNYNGYAHAFAGMGVQFVLFMGIELGVGLLLMRRMGLWKRLRAAPVSRGLLLGSRVASGAIIAALLLAGIYAAAMAIFGVRIEGSVAGFFLVAFAFALLASTFGLLIAALGRTPEATRGLAILATLLLVMLGGAWVPTFVFPEWLQSLTQFVPTRWAIDGLEATTWRGLGFGAVWAPFAAMLATSAAFAAIAV